MENRPVGLHEFVGRTNMCDERFSRDKQRLDKQEATLDEIKMLNVKLTEMIERHDEAVRKHDDRLAAIEKQPADTWGKVKAAIIGAVASGIAMAAINQVLNAPK
ncbi:hypothetical protein ACH6CV_14370 [Bacillota bacterium Meth-B3]